jgi:hypothetical protein
MTKYRQIPVVLESDFSNAIGQLFIEENKLLANAKFKFECIFQVQEYEKNKGKKKIIKKANLVAVSLNFDIKS